ncbi:MAG: UvrD-helicase domain-containing protein [Verrucomicrobiales bacterium]|nr:UvrD-helicase domain-containing protein [Verrucomicrobiales bacterium]
METIPNEMILASAGSGKTWQLTNRYIGLMATQLRSGAPVTPERIVAVTFTRKAAGEFFDSILEKLARAASDPNEGKNLASDAKDPLSAILGELTQAEYRLLLRIFIRKMPQLFLGTLDSFFSNILRAFPAEFGLAGDFEILDNHLAGTVRNDVYRSVFARQPEYIKGRGESQKEFMEAFRRATFGREESKIKYELDQYIDSLHEVYLHASPKELWGNPEMIWGNKCEWLGMNCNLEESFEQLFDIFCQDDISDGQMEVWQNFREQMIEHIPGTWFEAKAGYLLDKLLKQWQEIVDEEATIIVARSGQELSPAACNILYRIVTFIVGSELQVRLNRTRGVWHLLHLYEKSYSEIVRRRGKLTFQDLELLLAGHEYGNHGNAPILSQIPGDDDRLRIDYRLDARYDHWLLDEFQDTNYVQWKVIANLIDEAVQDTSDMRSLFQVGDIKQAIYAWRGGDTRLFHDIYTQYNTHEQRIQNRLLNISWRSGEDVIQTVNEIFGKESVLLAVDFPKKALNRWQWQNHEVAPPNKKMEGITMLVNPRPYTEGGDKVVSEDRYKLVVELLEEIQPVKRGLSCAILVQSNKSGREIVDFIRAESHSKITVMSESDIPVATDNALNRLILSLLTHAAHPGDSFSWNHLLLTPYRKFVEREELTVTSCGMRIARMVFEKGFEQVVRQTVSDIESVFPEGLDAFSKSRAEDMALAARVFDSGGSRDIEEFISYARSYTVRDPDTRSAVQVMTIHKSKGLTFDMVILPDLEGSALSTVRRSIGVKRNQNREVEWVYDLPNKVITELDPKLREYRKEREAEAAYEAMCKYYVALTRAKYANYLITNPRKKNARSENFVKMLEIALEDHAHEGQIGSLPVDVIYQSKLPTTNPNWYLAHEADTVSTEQAPRKRPAFTTPKSRERVNRRTPSGSEKHTVTAKLLFSRDGQMAREFGTLVHALFEDIEWIEDFDIAKADDRWRQLPGWTEQVLDEAISHTTAALQSVAVRKALKRPTPLSECWREKSFEILLNREWLSGTFDRVTIERDMFGNVVKATVLDFKTDRVKTPESIAKAVDKYQPQLDTYREVLQRMLRVPGKKIQLCLLFTRIGEIVEVM